MDKNPKSHIYSPSDFLGNFFKILQNSTKHDKLVADAK